MTTLSTNQIKEIEEFLITQYNIKYQDTRDEVLDHIACEIEELMNEDFGYEIAFKKTFNKWHNDLKPHPFIRYNNVPYYLGRQWVKRDVLNIILAMLIGIGVPYIFKNVIEDYHLANTIGIFISLTSIMTALFITIKYYGVKGYRISQLKKDILGYSGISLFYLVFFWGGFTYKLIPLLFIISLYQLYYILEISKLNIRTIN
ncbi:hypothetical protein HX063_14390 [Myroides odoratimimus]|uniref:hypothetical protein n=1 Tax=Myroides odoratimimus TaxID=76832 RepID=UPI002576C351|nr:hypothetical protein [Myroides odoratimimus]MDM1496586.1 hypothetical protein [Myroides odoratimimus]